MAITYAHSSSRQTVVLGTVIGLHALLGIGLLIGTAVSYIGKERPHLIAIIDPPSERDIKPVQPPPLRPLAPEHRVGPLPKGDEVTVIGPPGGITLPPKGPDAVIDRPVTSTPATITPVQMTAAGRRLLADACAERYPAASIREDEQGLVRINVLVGPDGRAIDTHIEESSGFPRLDQATAACVKAAGRAFVAQQTGDRATAAWQTMVYRWKLN